MQRHILPLGLAALLMAGCAVNDQRVYEKTHVGLYEPVAQEVYSLDGAKPRFARNQTPAGQPLRNGGATFERGFSVSGQQRIFYALDEDSTVLKGTVCMDETSPRGAKAHVAFSGNGKVFWEADLTKGSFEEVNKSFKGTDNLMIAVDADDSAVVDFLEFRLEGGVRLRETMTAGRTNYYGQCRGPAFKPFATYTVQGNTIFCRESYGEYGPVIGVSNAYACAMVAPEHSGMLVHYGLDASRSYGGTTQSFLQPEEEMAPTRKYGAMVAQPRKWKWRVEEDGAIRVLGPYDLMNGARSMILYRMNPRSGELQIDAMMKNITSHDIMGCVSLVTRLPKGSKTIIAAEEAKPGYSLVKGADQGITCKSGAVMVNDLESWEALKGPQKLLQKRNGDFRVALGAGRYFEAVSQAPKGGYYPYDGLRLALYNSESGVRATQYGEKLKVGPTQTLHLRTLLNLVY